MLNFALRYYISFANVLLQIFYLDQLDSEATGCGVPRDVLPRVAAYDYKSLYQLIDLDRQPEWPEGGLKLFGKLNVSAKYSCMNVNE